MEPKKLENTLDGINHRSTPTRPSNSWQLQNNSFAPLTPNDDSSFESKNSNSPGISTIPTTIESSTQIPIDNLQQSTTIILEAMKQMSAATNTKIDENIQNLRSEFDSKISHLEEKIKDSNDKIKDSVNMKDISSIITSNLSSSSLKNDLALKIESDIISKLPDPNTMQDLIDDVQELKVSSSTTTSTPKTSTSTSFSSTDPEVHFPILKILRITNISKVFSDKMKDITLQGDDIMNLQLFWDEIIAAMSISLGTSVNNLLPPYHQLYLHPKISTKEHLTLNPSHPRYGDSLQAYNMFSSIVKTHLLRPTTIDQTIAPFSYNTWLLFKPITTNLDGIQIAHTIISNVSPQLQGPRRDIVPTIMKLTITKDMNLFEFQNKTLSIFNELDIIQDDSGGKAKLAEQYLKQLSLVPTFDIPLHYQHTNVTKTNNERGYIEASHTIFKTTNFFENVYNELTLNDPTKIIPLDICPKRAKTVPIITTGEKIETVVCKIIDQKTEHQVKIAQARLTKSTFQQEMNKKKPTRNFNQGSNGHRQGNRQP